ncbi:ferritin-like domain-containing protein [Ramlibacter monticola]|uniref:Ferritin-like domain-containing protein n=1 Tax=Ramlibacter monticola TaxID=1926872 RepID=A0A936YYM8_9BURK|nr:ferritin-like domain-containing protein [Ramlibacter monticola]MBL0390370.1 ferritin-like domain-containing protein [Ramlibacter monticola]
MELRQQALRALRESDPRAKAAQARALHGMAGQLPLSPSAPPPPAALPGRPERPRLVHPAQVPRRSPGTPEGLAALLHAIAHIEFNAINLALDAVWRFEGMPEAFHHDWLRVAAEEAFHFTLLADHLATMGHAYGDFDAHDGLWAMCEKTKEDVVARMALVPRTLEARGLDATPQIQRKLRQVGTAAALRAVEILDVILRDEVGHVAIGNHWYRHLCEREGLDPVAHYGALVERYAAPRLHPPFNFDARRRAGFSEAELAYLAGSPDLSSRP